MSDLLALYEEADQLKDQGKYEECVAKLKQILEQDETHVLSHMALAVVLGKLGQYDESVQHAQRACELEPDAPFNFTALSVSYQRAFAGTQNQSYIQLAEDAMAKSQTLAYQQRQQQNNPG